jgi:hypothetical protein
MPISHWLKGSVARAVAWRQTNDLPIRLSVEISSPRQRMPAALIAARRVSAGLMTLLARLGQRRCDAAYYRFPLDSWSIP